MIETEIHHQTFFAEVWLPVPLAGSFTYRIPRSLSALVSIGCRVIVQFGRKKIYTGIVHNIHENPPKDYQAKYILSLLDDKAVVTENQLKFWEWMASYYMCAEGEVMNAALPSGMKLASETKILLHPDFNSDYTQLNDKEFLIAEALESHQILSLTEASKILDQEKIMPLIKSLIEKNVIMVEEELKEKYKPKLEKWLSLNPEHEDENKLHELFDTLEKKAFRQLEALMSFLQLSPMRDGGRKPIKKSDLKEKLKDKSSGLTGLIKKDILLEEEREISRLAHYTETCHPDSIELNAEQEQALSDIKEQCNSGKAVLLHGVTGSGKTEIYIKLIHEALSEGKQVLYLLPEIALTAQIINRLKKFFGEMTGVYHSRYNEMERVEIWNTVLANNNRYRLIIGARSSMFLPFKNLGLIIIDEEHDGSFRQHDPAPRYNARDASLVLARQFGAKVVLGSATPSLESYQNTLQGKYGIATLFKRFGDIQMPEILVADLKDEQKKGKMQSHFSSFLINNIHKALQNGQQIILFQNRRGFSLRLECQSCGWVPECKSCDVSLVYHKIKGHLRCHYCGYTQKIPSQCPVCKGTNLKMVGFGTEKIEDELQLIFPDARIARMDLDTTRSKNSYYNLISDFEEKKTDILVGTQMVTKGLDFDNVGLVGVLNADGMINYPDFRSFERSFQLLAQVSGRAGRKKKRGKVIIQTKKPYHAIIRYVMENDFQSMFQSQLQERQKFKYPPFYRLIRITVRHKEQEITQAASMEIGQLLKRKLGDRVLGPEFPMVNRVRNQYRMQLLIKVEHSLSLKALKIFILERIEYFKRTSDHRSVQLIFEVDPS